MKNVFIKIRKPYAPPIRIIKSKKDLKRMERIKINLEDYEDDIFEEIKI